MYFKSPVVAFLHAKHFYKLMLFIEQCHCVTFIYNVLHCCFVMLKIIMCSESDSDYIIH